MKSTLLGEQPNFSAASPLPLERFAERSYFSLYIYAFLTLQLWFQLVNNYRKFTWSRKYLFGCISASIGVICLKLPTLNSPSLHYKHCIYHPTFIKNMETNLYIYIQIFLLLCGSECRRLILQEEHRLGLYESRMPMKIFGVKNEEVIGGWRQLLNEMHKIDRECATQEGIREVYVAFC